MSAIVLFIILIACLILGIPVCGAIGAASIIYMIANDISPFILVQRLYAGVDSMTLTALPGFIVAGSLMEGGGIARRLIAFCEIFVSKITGGLAMMAVLAASLFGAISGSGVAATATIGGIMIPEMEKRNYPRPFSAAVAASGGVLDGVIPPSVAMVVYGATVNTSIVDLFKAGFSIGLFMCITSMVLCYAIGKRRNFAYTGTSYKFHDIIRVTREALWALGAPFIIMGGMFSGIFTPTEASVATIIYCSLVGIFVFKELSLKKFLDSLLSAAVTSASIMLIISFATLFGWGVAAEQVPQSVLTWLVSVTQNKYLVLLLIDAFIFIAGMFMNGITIIILAAPLISVIAAGLGMNPTHFGIMIMTFLALGNITPPFGTCLYTAAMVSGESVESVAKEIIPFIITYAIYAVSLMFFPWLALLFV